MFVVICTSPIDGSWEERDALIYEAAGRHSDGSGATFEKGGFGGIRDHTWIVYDIVDAMEMAQALNLVEGVKATMREK